MEVKGKLIEIFDTTQISDRFQKREFVLEYADNPQYPEFIKFEAIQDRCGMLDEYKVGDEVTVSFNLKGRKWTDRQGETKYFNSLQAWRMQKESGTPSAPTHEASSTDNLPFADEGGDEDDLPF
ncbi:single-stranded DNA-binding protein [Catalinimonas alkaloidigena]|uniref:DUF3127 domain-containing protein n=1 Tax=Catalinimonas alkaloidigena TaxID=1075417 RepID=UPI002406BFE7|nr:DUF3127 domain-containing protein [Catalinimonas alkaloidigena]MDF9798480.1 single-stranded DNA-binding protein [Catalinimonas alkaloidigena]